MKYVIYVSMCTVMYVYDKHVQTGVTLMCLKHTNQRCIKTNRTAFQNQLNVICRVLNHLIAEYIKRTIWEGDFVASDVT